LKDNSKGLSKIVTNAYKTQRANAEPKLQPPSSKKCSTPN